MDRHHASDRPSGPSPTPDALSHRQLSEWLQQAPREADHAAPSSAAPAASDAGIDSLQELLRQHESLSQSLLQELSRQGDSLQATYSAPQLMALGALAAHLRLGLQAIAASRR